MVKEYIDSKNKTHCVEHITLTCENENDSNRLMEELWLALTGKLR